MLTLPTELLARLLQAILTTATPAPELPAPLSGVLLAVSGDGLVTMAATDSVVMAVASARALVFRYVHSRPIPPAADDVDPLPSAGMWHLDADDAAVLWRVCTSRVGLCANTILRAGFGGDQTTLVFDWNDGVHTTAVRLHPSTPAYPDWRHLLPRVAVAGAVDSAVTLTSTSFPVAELTATLRSAATADAITLSAQTEAVAEQTGALAQVASFGRYDPMRLLPVLEAAGSLPCQEVTLSKAKGPLLHIEAVCDEGLLTVDWLITGLRPAETAGLAPA